MNAVNVSSKWRNSSSCNDTSLSWSIVILGQDGWYLKRCVHFKIPIPEKEYCTILVEYWLTILESQDSLFTILVIMLVILVLQNCEECIFFAFHLTCCYVDCLCWIICIGLLYRIIQGKRYNLFQYRAIFAFSWKRKLVRILKYISLYVCHILTWKFMLC